VKIRVASAKSASSIASSWWLPFWLRMNSIAAGTPASWKASASCPPPDGVSCAEMPRAGGQCRCGGNRAPRPGAARGLDADRARLILARAMGIARHTRRIEARLAQPVEQALGEGEIGLDRVRRGHVRSRGRCRRRRG
jgi:hypothetical protein